MGVECIFKHKRGEKCNSSIFEREGSVIYSIKNKK